MKYHTPWFLAETRANYESPHSGEYRIAVSSQAYSASGPVTEHLFEVVLHVTRTKEGWAGYFLHEGNVHQKEIIVQVSEGEEGLIRARKALIRSAESSARRIGESKYLTA